MTVLIDFRAELKVNTLMNLSSGTASRYDCTKKMDYSREETKLAIHECQFIDLFKRDKILRRNVREFKQARMISVSAEWVAFYNRQSTRH